MKKIFKSAHNNRRCTSSICIQTLCKVWDRRTDGESGS